MPTNPPLPAADRGMPAYLSGLVLVTIITASIYGLRYIPVVSIVSPMISAIFVGILFANTLGIAESALAGVAVARLGLGTSLVKLLDRSFKPLLLGGLTTLFISALSLLLVQFIG